MILLCETLRDVAFLKSTWLKWVVMAIMKIELNMEKRIFGLDLLRFVAIFLVMRVHAKEHYITPFFKASSSGFWYPDGVNLFFVLSGFLIGGIIIRDMSQQRIDFPMIRKFWRFRWFRTLPNYYLVLLLVLIYMQVVFHSTAGFDFSFFIFCQNLFTIHSDFFGVAWSLAVEEWFYLVYPLVLWGFSKAIPKAGFRNWMLLSIFFMLGYPLIARVLNLLPHVLTLDYQAILQEKKTPHFFRKIVFYRMDSIAFGILAAYVMHYHASIWHRVKYPALVIGTFLLFTKIQFLLFRKINMMIFYPYVEILGTCLILPFLSSLRKAPSFISVPITHISMISYSLYLLHFSLILNVMVTFIDKPTNIREALFLHGLYYVISFVLAHLLYKYFEKPVMDLRSRQGSLWQAIRTGKPAKV